MKTLGPRSAALFAFSLVVGAASAAAAAPGCTDKCTTKGNTCTQAKEKSYKNCLARADKWKSQRDKAAAKAKKPEQAKARLELRFGKKKQACEAAKSKAETTCTKTAARCTKACAKPVKKVKRAKAIKKVNKAKVAKKAKKA